MISAVTPRPPARRFRLGGDALTLTALLLLFGVLSFAILGQDKKQSNPFDAMRRSSFVAEPNGWKAFYRLLAQRGDHVEQWKRHPREWPADAGVIITGPYQVGGATSLWDPREARDALKWVTDGGTLIAFTDADDPLTRALGVSARHRTPVMDDAEDTEDTDGGGDRTPSPSASPFPSSSPAPRSRDRENEPDTVAAPVRPKGRALALLQPAVFFSGVQRLVPAARNRYLRIPAASVPLAADTAPLIVAVQHGKGRLIAISDAGMVDNSHLAAGDNARFAAQLVEGFAAGNPGRPRVLFDEYHQNYQQAESFWTAIGRPGQLAFWQLIVVGLLMVYSYSRRFGLPVPMQAPPRVSSEYVASLADLYRRAHATDAALEVISRLFWRDLCRAAGMPLESEPAVVAARMASLAPGTTGAEAGPLAARIVAAVQASREAVASASSMIAAPEATARGKRQSNRSHPILTEAEMLRLAREMEALRKELDLGGIVSAG